jgi:hypothetical protein
MGTRDNVAVDPATSRNTERFHLDYAPGDTQATRTFLGALAFQPPKPTNRTPPSPSDRPQKLRVKCWL